MHIPWDDSRTAFADAAQWFLATVAVVDGRWDALGLGEWDIRALVGHTSRSLITVETYLAHPATKVDISSPTGYYRATRDISAGAAVAERGREAGRALGDDPPAAVGELAARVVPLVSGHDGTQLVSTIAGGMRLSDYLPTRTFELVVHTADLRRALDLPLTLPARPARHALQIVAELAVEEGLAGPLLFAATGRPGLSPGFSVL